MKGNRANTTVGYLMSETHNRGFNIIIDSICHSIILRSISVFPVSLWHLMHLKKCSSIEWLYLVCIKINGIIIYDSILYQFMLSTDFNAYQMKTKLSFSAVK